MPHALANQSQGVIFSTNQAQKEGSQTAGFNEVLRGQPAATYFYSCSICLLLFEKNQH